MRKLFTVDLFLILLVPTAFLIVSFLTLSDYGINWDSPKHFIRGQSYLHFILTSNRDFLNLPNVENPNVNRSYFQSNFYTFDYFMTKHVHTHPEVNDLLIALTNYIFYQHGWIGDIEAYHLFIVLVTFALVIGVAIWTYQYFGLFSSLVATSSLVLYPLVFAESHFNVKDPVLMSFFGLAILSFWFGFSNKKAKLILSSAIFAGFALGTKFNAFFLPFILGPWVIFDFWLHRKEGKSLFSLIGGPRIITSLLLYPLIMLTVLYSFSPYLWANPIVHFMEIIKYYKEIGISTPVEQANYLVWGWNTYPLLWIIYTTPLTILFLFLVGFFYSVFLIIRKRSEMAVLILAWFIVPVVRVIWPGTNIYGGDRQIMEFIPAMAILAGIGAFFLVKRIGKSISVLIIISLLFIVHELISIHPNENVYFNQLVGGLKGARDKGIPSWGNTYGNVYLQGINWLNKNAEVNAKLAIPINYISSIPRLKLRRDIDLDNHYFSGQDRKGEYAMEMDYDWSLKSRYKYAYYEIFLNPVYQVEVNGIPLLKIWKNDLKHTKVGYDKEIEIVPFSVKVEQQKLKIDFGNLIFLTRLIIYHSDSNCEKQLGDGFLAISKDNDNFVREPDPLVDLESPESTPGMDETTFVHLFPAIPVRSLIFNSRQDQSCILKDYKVRVMGLKR